MAKQWTEEEIEFLKEWYPTSSLAECAEALDRSVDAIRTKASNLSLKAQTKEVLPKYTDEYLLKTLKDFKSRVGRVPYQSDCVGDKYLKGTKTYCRRFGSWNKALIKAGLELNRESLSDEELLSTLKDFYSINNRSPETREFKGCEYLQGLSIYSTRFGTVNKALKLAGLPINTEVNITDEYLLNTLKRFYKEKDRAPHTLECIGEHPYLKAASTYSTRFGSFLKALDIANIPRNKLNNTSLQELELVDFIKTIYSKKLILNSRPLNGREIDIIIPEYNLAIEFNGVYWHSEAMGKDKHYHLNKTIEAKKQGYHLIHILDEEWLQKPNIVKSRIKNLLGLSKTVYARKCKIKEVTSGTSKNFLNTSHIQGNANGSVRLGLYLADELVALMTFCKSRFSTKYEWELLRYCNKLNTSVVGGASRLFKYFLNNYNPLSIISYSDLRWNKGNLYNTLGFDLSHSSNPNYWYFKHKGLESRMRYQKHKLKDLLSTFDSSKTEYENMLANGYNRFFDCGNNVYTYRGT